MHVGDDDDYNDDDNDNDGHGIVLLNNLLEMIIYLIK